jgi:outer membrane PBP1 activator LpoA protein
VDELVRDAKRPLEELTSQQRENIALLKEKLDLNERQVRAALGILGARSGWRPSLSKSQSASY